MLNLHGLLGVGFGSKYSGTTSTCFFLNDGLYFDSCKKNRDADEFILQTVNSRDFKQIFIDAPLSLPLAFYKNSSNADYFYREADKEIGAMSPMFLGGLTARAFNIKNKVSSRCEVYECYPTQLAKMYTLTEFGYKTETAYINKCLQILKDQYAWNIPHKPKTWYEFDALLAWIIGYRYMNGVAQKFGNSDEGFIWV